MTENRGPEVAGTAGLFLGLTTIATILRCYCRIALVKSFGPDDYLAVIAQIFFMFFCGFAIAGVAYGTGQHAWDIKPPSNIPIGLKWWWACEPVYVLSNMALKFSIGIFLLRVAVDKTQRAIIYVTMAVSGVMCTYFFFLFVFQCWPVAYFWGQYTGMKGSCINPIITVKSVYAYSAVSCWSDWTFSILPAFIVWKLNMNQRTKLSVFMILALCAVASTATIVRFPYIDGMSNYADFLYATTDVAIWSLAETGIGITACCAATLRPLFRTFLSRSRLFGKSTNSKEGTTGWRYSSNPSRGGYLRRTGRDTEEEIDLRDDVSKNGIVTTVVGGRGSHEQDVEMGAHHDGKIAVSKDVHIKESSREWDGSQTNLNDASSVGSEEVASWGGDKARRS